MTATPGAAAQTVVRAAGAVLLVATTWVLGASASAQGVDQSERVSGRCGLVVSGGTRPARVEIERVEIERVEIERVEIEILGPEPARSDMERAVRELLRAAPAPTSTEGAASYLIAPLAGGAEAAVKEQNPQVAQILIDVSDPARVRVVIPGAGGPAQPPVVREIAADRSSAAVAREAVAQIVQATVRAVLDRDVAPDANAPDANAPTLVPPPVAPPPVASRPPPPPPPSAIVASKAGPRPAPAYSAVVSIGHHTFPFGLAEPPGSDRIIDGLALSLGRRRGAVAMTARLSGEWSQYSAVGVVLIGTQIVTASAGASAHVDLGRVALAVGVEAGALVMHQNVSLQDDGPGPAGLIFTLPGTVGNSWSAGPMAGLRGTVCVDVFPRAFLQLEVGMPVVLLNRRDDTGNSAWRFDRYQQVMLGAGYDL